MAFIGMRTPKAAPITAYTEGSAIIYGTLVTVAHAISASITLNRADNPLYGDDTIVENDNGITSGEITFTGDDLSFAVRKTLLGLVEHNDGQSTPTVTKYEVTDEATPYVGFGFIRVRRIDGVTKYNAVWYHRVQFRMDSEEANTKGENIEWGTPQIVGKIFPVYLDSTGKASLCYEMEYATESAAEAFLATCAGSTGTST